MVPSRDEGGRSAIEEARRNYASAIGEAYRVNERYFLDMEEAATLLDSVLNHPVARLSLTALEAKQARSCCELYRQLGNYRFKNHALEDLTGQTLMAQLEDLRSNENLRRIETTLVGLGEYSQLDKLLQKIGNNPQTKKHKDLQRDLSSLTFLLPKPFQVATSGRRMPITEMIKAAENSGDYIAEACKERLKNLERGFLNDAKKNNEMLRRVEPLLENRSRVMQLIELNSKKSTEPFRKWLRLRSLIKSGHRSANKKETPYGNFISAAQRAQLSKLTLRDRAKKTDELLKQVLFKLEQEIAAELRFVLQEKPSLSQSDSDAKRLESWIKFLEKVSNKLPGLVDSELAAKLFKSDPKAQEEFLKASPERQAEVVKNVLDQLKAERDELRQASPSLKQNIRSSFFREPPKASEAEKTGSDLSKIPVIRIR